MPALEGLIGTWRTIADFPHADMGEAEGRTTFEWLLGGAFVLQRASAPHPAAPDGHCILTEDTQHYFDSRGIVRTYAMTFDGDVWTLERGAQPGSEWAQAFRAERDGDDRWVGAWRREQDGAWIHDFDLIYERV